MTTDYTREPIKIIADILKTELGLSSGQIMVSYQKWNIPQNDGLYVVLSESGPVKVIGNNNYYDANSNTEIQEVSALHTIQIDFMSFDKSARTRMIDVAKALASRYAQEQEEKYQIQIARNVSPFIDASSEENTKILNRFITTISVFALSRTEKSATYYDTFYQVDIYEEE